MRNFLFLIIIVISSCTFTQKIKDGEMAYDRKQYSVAISMLNDEYERIEYPEVKARKAFLIAESYKEINNVQESIEWYKNAFDLKYGDKALEELAYALKKNEQYKEAVNVFKALQKRVGQSTKVSKEISECSMAVDWTIEAKRTPFQVQNIPQNSEYSDYAPTIFEGGQLMFTSDRRNAKNQDIYNWTGNWFSDLYIVNQFSKELVPFDGKINSAHNDGTASFNSDFTEVFFTRCKSELDDDYCKLYSSRRVTGGWSEPKILDFIEDRTNYGHPSLHQGDSILFYSAEIESGFGGYDIYYVQRLENGWTEPQVLSSQINSIGNEKFPFIYEDTLYFSSDGKPGMGGLDIFKTHVKEDGSWAPSENLKPPFNSGGDDFALIVDIERRKNTGEFLGYFTSARKGSASDDIYAFKSRIIELPPEEKDEVVVETEKVKLYLAIKTFENSYLVDDDPLSGVVGKDNLTDVTLEITGKNGSKVFSSGDKAFFIMDIQEGDSYSIKASKGSYLTEIASFTPSDIPSSGEKTYNINMLLEKIFADREIELENIYYDFRESFIREDAKPSLNNLATLLKNNPEIKIQLFSHTDCRGKDDLNEKLSQARANAAVNYLKSVGINQNRMTATGLGESRPSINCYCETCSEEEHQENRRTTFKIVEF